MQQMPMQQMPMQQMQMPMMPGQMQMPMMPGQMNPMARKGKPTTSDFAVMNMPSVGNRNKNAKPNKANLRAALNGSDFGI